MRAFVSKIVDGRTTVGTTNNRVTGDYKTRKNLIRFGVRPILNLGESAQVELFYNWDNRYGQADETFKYIRLAK